MACLTYWLPLAHKNNELDALGDVMKSIFAAMLTSAFALGLAPAMAADLIIEDAVSAQGVVEVGGSWEGVYLGTFLGGAVGSISEVDGVEEHDISGWLVGAAVGANFYLTDNVVAGIVGDIAWSNIVDDGDEAGFDWVGSLRGRLGVDAGGFLPYLTAGVAAGGGYIEIENAVHLGWTVGAGVEVAITDDLSLDLLYRYTDYGSHDYFDDGNDWAFKTHQATVGLNWKF